MTPFPLRVLSIRQAQTLSTWQPTLQCQFVEPVLRNIAAAIDTYQADALAWAADPEPAPANFKVMQTAQTVDIQYPYCYLLANRSVVQLDADDAGVDADHSLIIELATNGSNAVQLAHEMYIRVRAVQSILFEMRPLDYLQGLDRAGLFSLGPITHDYGQFVRENAQQKYLQVCQLTTTFSFRER